MVGRGEARTPRDPHFLQDLKRGGGELTEKGISHCDVGPFEKSAAKR